MNLSLALEQNPLPTHELTSVPGQNFAIESAAGLLGQYADFVRLHVKQIYWMKLKDDMSDECITSASFPKLPDYIFISNKALVHIPPNRIFESPSLYALAENIYHEAIHQHVNADVLREEIMAEIFDSATSPKIEISWRRNQEARNQFWELDRAYHAACVYSGLLPLRRKFADAGIKEFEAAVLEGEQALAYLLDKLENFHEFFKSKGIETLKHLRSESYV